MIYTIINFIALLGLSFIIVSFIKVVILRILVSFLLSSFILLQLISVYITGDFIGYSFYLHFNYDDIAEMKSLFGSQLLLSLIMLIFICCILYFSYGKICKMNKYLSNYKKLVLAIFFIPLLSFKGGMVCSTINLARILNVENEGFNSALNSLNIKHYIIPQAIKAKKGKNIIVISLESFEKGYLSKEKSHLTPNLRDLRKKWTYFDMEQTPGSGWTLGSLYTSLTGFPAYFNIHGNSIFQTSYDSDISSVNHVLKKAGYTDTFLIGNAKFAGTEDLLKAYKFNNIIDRRNLSTKYINDKDLFEEAKKTLLSFKETKKPYSLFISTISTHFPNGVYDKRMEEFIEPKDTSLEFMVAATDHLVGDFIKFMEQEELLENTIVYIYPDHLKMGDPSVFDGTGERGLFLLTNAKKNSISFDNSKSLYQIDIPKILLEGASVKHNISFLTDYIKGDKITYLTDKNNISGITSINTSGLKKQKEDNEVFQRITENQKYQKNIYKDTTRYIAHAGGKIDGHTYTNSLEALNLSYSKGIRLFELDFIKTSDGKYVAAHDWAFWAKITGNNGKDHVTEEYFMSQRIKEKYSPMNMEIVNKWFADHPDAILVTDKVNNPKEFSEIFIDKKRLMMELFTYEAVKEAQNIGIRSAMPSQTVINNLGENKISMLRWLEVKDIAVSRRYIASNKDFLLRVKENGIKTYVYHVNFDEGKDEKYVLENEMDYIYGFYADDFEFFGKEKE
ncbi:sulfatase-like hydrolase/transferase [Aquimarina sp. SS2-1]|uniref:sulfatase-like hydrolase/transferase n=1 Tax=Aquimarina besae TaxID=3342247 RepID=UPI003671D242